MIIAHKMGHNSSKEFDVLWLHLGQNMKLGRNVLTILVQMAIRPNVIPSRAFFDMFIFWKCLKVYNLELQHFLNKSW